MEMDMETMWSRPTVSTPTNPLRANKPIALQICVWLNTIQKDMEVDAEVYVE